MASANTIEAVDKLDDILRHRHKREQFHQNPEQAMHDAGGNPAHVPQEVWGTLTHMSPDELAAIAELGVALDDSGLFDGSVTWRHVV
jgi:hypothetical protein